MSKRIPPRTALVLSLFLSLCGAAAESNVARAQTPSDTASQASATKSCRATADAEIVAAIHEKIKADTRFDGQWSHINVMSSNRVVTLRGWVEGRVLANALIKHARTTRCVRKVNSKWLRTFRSTAGCLSTQKRCGEVCIDRSEPCNLIQ